MVRGIIGFVSVAMLVTVNPVSGQRPKRTERPADTQSQSVPLGMCRVWLDGVRPDRQPAATDCASALRNRPQNARVIFGQRDDRRSQPRRPARDSARPDNRDNRRGERPERKSPDKPAHPGS